MITELLAENLKFDPCDLKFYIQIKIELEPEVRE